MRSLVGLVAFVTLAVAACEKHSLIGDKYVTLSYQQTLCADPWKTGPNQDSTLKNIARYLDSAGLYVADLQLKGDALTIVCEACFCKTGRTIYVTTLDSDTLRAGFKKVGFN